MIIGEMMRGYKDYYVDKWGDRYSEYDDYDGYKTWTTGDMDLPDVVLFRSAFSDVSGALEQLDVMLEEIGINPRASDSSIVIGDLTIDQVLGIAREVVTLQRKMSNARSALDRVNDRVITAQEQARKVEKTINALES